MKLKNDKERKEFVNNPENWELVGELNGLIRLKKLTYGKKEWFAIYVRKSYDHYDYREKQMKEVIEWQRARIHTLNTEIRAFGQEYSPSQIVEEIKDMDREARKK